MSYCYSITNKPCIFSAYFVTGPIPRVTSYHPHDNSIKQTIVMVISQMRKQRPKEVKTLI